MPYETSFGHLSQERRADHQGGQAGARFRLAVLGDFSGRANAGRVELGAALAGRTPIAVDVDTLDDVMARMKLVLRLPLAQGEGDEGSEVVAVPVACLDDFHPDQLAETVEVFGSLLELRRNLGSTAGFARAAKEVMGWSGEAALPRAPAVARGSEVATDKRLSDFARLTGRTPAAPPAAEVEDLVRRLVGPFVQAARDPQADALMSQVDAALSAAMRRVLHHPDFQAAEALWRSVDLLVRRIETGARMQVVLYDVSAEEWAADLAAADALETSGLYGMLVEAPALDANQGPFSAVVGLYGFALSPPHADLLGRMAQLAAAAGAPFVSSLEPDGLQVPMHEQNPLVRQAWGELQALPASAYLGLATVRFLLRMPYGRRSDPIEAFKFEEFTREAGLSGMLWGNPAVAAGLLLAQGWAKAGAKMQPGTPSVVGDMPYYVYTPPGGDQVALPCTERLWSERQVAAASAYHVMPVVSLRGRPEVRLAGTASVAGPVLAGPWAPVAMTAPVPVAPVPAAEVPVVEVPGAEEVEVQPDAVVENAGSAPDAEVDLDALMASLSAEAPPAADGETEVDLDALLASL